MVCTLPEETKADIEETRESLEVHMIGDHDAQILGRLYQISEENLELLVEYPCFRLPENQYFKGHQVLWECNQEESWDQGYDLLWAEDPETRLAYVFVHEFSLVGPIFKGRLACSPSQIATNDFYP